MTAIKPLVATITLGRTFCCVPSSCRRGDAWPLFNAFDQDLARSRPSTSRNTISSPSSASQTLMSCTAGCLRLRLARARWRRSAPQPLADRKAALRKLLRRNNGSIQYVEYTEADGDEMFAAVCKLGLEGMVSKRLNAPYRSGPSKAWIKVKLRRMFACASCVT